jgi:hypothetical protein
MSTRVRRWVFVPLGAVLASMALSGLWQSAHAQSAPNFGSYTIAATAPGWEMWEDEPSANAHPEGGGLAPYSTSALGGGGQGVALSSIAWPGDTEANGGKVALLLFPHDAQVPGGGPDVQFPDAVSQLAGTALPLANYPVRAQADAGSTTHDSSLDAQGATLKAHADSLLAQATATMTGANGQANFTFGNATTVATSTLHDTVGEATADSKISNINIGGVIKIDSVTSNANATTDAATGKSGGVTVVQGMTIAGQPAYVDESGVHIGSQGQPANAIASQVANQALNSGGFKFYVAQAQHEASGASASYTAGSLYIIWTIPQDPSGNVFVIALGGARASVTASPGSEFNVPSSDTGNVTSTPPPVVNAPTSGGITSKPVTSASPSVARPATTSPRASGGLPIAATFGGLGGQATLGVVGTGLMFFGFKRAATEIVDRVPSTCPLETT